MGSAFLRARRSGGIRVVLWQIDSINLLSRSRCSSFRTCFLRAYCLAFLRACIIGHLFANIDSYTMTDRIACRPRRQFLTSSTPIEYGPRSFSQDFLRC